MKRDADARTTTATLVTHSVLTAKRRNANVNVANSDSVKALLDVHIGYVYPAIGNEVGVADTTSA